MSVEPSTVAAVLGGLIGATGTATFTAWYNRARPTVDVLSVSISSETKLPFMTEVPSKLLGATEAFPWGIEYEDQETTALPPVARHSKLRDWYIYCDAFLKESSSWLDLVQNQIDSLTGPISAAAKAEGAEELLRELGLGNTIRGMVRMKKVVFADGSGLPKQAHVIEIREPGKAKGAFRVHFEAFFFDITYIDDHERQLMLNLCCVLFEPPGPRDTELRDLLTKTKIDVMQTRDIAQTIRNECERLVWNRSHFTVETRISNSGKSSVLLEGTAGLFLRYGEHHYAPIDVFYLSENQSKELGRSDLAKQIEHDFEVSIEEHAFLRRENIAIPPGSSIPVLFVAEKSMDIIGREMDAIKGLYASRNPEMRAWIEIPVVRGGLRGSVRSKPVEVFPTQHQ